MAVNDEKGGGCEGWIDVGAGGFFLAWAALGWIGLLSNDQLLQTQRSWFVVGPGLLPFWGLVILSMGGLVMMLKGGWSVLRRAAEQGSIDWKQHGYAVAMLASLVALVGSMQVTGFFISALVFCLVWTLTLSRGVVREAYRVTLTAVGSSLLIAGLLYLVFVELVNVPLP
ncbi:tripartite tricarboxylate transporter TctB family protein [Halopseudomonas xiamenensis]|uniref:tripartite tricarboxylate transporter TctB family protein n=1 Tax=Halopseudomonas xiamenensis TaxID=157792 RepID=UPI00162879F1|nr:tripartite tricarboxylate transporter TctB family protein [Halopseudomonas xiamenensis]